MEFEKREKHFLELVLLLVRLHRLTVLVYGVLLFLITVLAAEDDGRHFSLIPLPRQVLLHAPDLRVHRHLSVPLVEELRTIPEQPLRRLLILGQLFSLLEADVLIVWHLVEITTALVFVAVELAVGRDDREIRLAESH